MGNNCLIIFLLKESLETNLDSCLYCYMTFEFFRISTLQNNVIFIIIFFHKSVNISLGNSTYIFCDLVYRIGVNLPAKFDLSLYLVTLCNCYVAHVVCNTAYTDMAAFHNTNGSSHPGCKTLLNLLVCPVSYNDLALDSHTGNHRSIFTAAVCRLVLIHEIHINGVVWNFLVELCVKMAQRLSVFLQSQNPGFCRGKGVHPGDYTCTILICICLVEGLADQFVCDQGWLPHDLIGKHSGFVQLIHNNAGMLCYLAKALISIKVL